MGGVRGPARAKAFEDWVRLYFIWTVLPGRVMASMAGACGY